MNYLFKLFPPFHKYLSCIHHGPCTIHKFKLDKYLCIFFSAQFLYRITDFQKAVSHLDKTKWIGKSWYPVTFKLITNYMEKVVKLLCIFNLATS